MPAKKDDEEKTMHCGFCKKSQNDVKKLAVGQTGFICDKCVTLCMNIILDGMEEEEVESKLQDLRREYNRRKSEATEKAIPFPEVSLEP